MNYNLSIILCILLICLLLAVVAETIYIVRYKNNKKKKKSDVVSDLATELIKIKKENDFGAVKEKDVILIDDYLNTVKEILSVYESSRNKIVSYRTRRKLLYNTILIIPIISKYTNIYFDYDTTSKILSKKSDKDIMTLLLEAYNSFSLEAPEAFNDLILASLLLSDNR